MKKFFVFLVAVIITVNSSSVKAQNYDSAIGAALGTAMGLSYKQKMGSHQMLETTIGGSFRPSGFYFDVFYDFYFPLQQIDNNLNLYAGPGLNIGSWGNKSSSFTMGFAFNLGLDYKLPNAPLNLSFDWRPDIQFAGYNGAWRGNTFAFGIRYVLK